MSGDHEGDRTSELKQQRICCSDDVQLYNDDAVSHLQPQQRRDIDKGIIIFGNKLKAHCRDKAGNNQQEQE